MVLTLREAAAGAKQYFLHSWLWMIVNLLIGAALWGGQTLAARLPSGLNASLKLIFFLIGLVAFTLQFLTPAYLMVQDRKNLALAWRNSWRLLTSAPLFTLGVSGSALLALVVSLILVAPLAVGGPALLALLANQAVIDHPDTVPVLDD